VSPSATSDAASGIGVSANAVSGSAPVDNLSAKESETWVAAASPLPLPYTCARSPILFNVAGFAAAIRQVTHAIVC
jgi:hypothetical protein